MSRGRLLEEVWTGIAVTDDVLTRSIAELRKAFGDRPSAPRYIETIPKSGYRLIAPVDLPAVDLPAEPEPTVAADHPRPSRGLWVAMAAVSAVLAVAVVAVRLAYRPQPAVLGTPFRATPVTSFPGRETQPACSPDGTQVAFAWQGEASDNWDVYVRLVDGEGILRLTHDPAADHAPAWSSDGTRVAFIRYRGDSCDIYAVPAIGGAERKLGSCGQNVRPDLVWSPDGRWLAFSDRPTNAESFGIFLLAAETRKQRKLVAPGSQHWGDVDPSFSPDSRWLAFTRSTSASTDDLFRISVSGGEPERMTFDGRRIGGHSWSSDGRSIVFVSERGGRAEMWLIPSSGGRARWLPIGSNLPRNPDWSRTGNDLLFEQWSYASDILRLDLAAGDSEPEPWVSSTREDSLPAVSPHGRRTAFVSDRSGHHEIWVRDNDHGELLQLTSFAGPYTGSPHWSPDSSSLAFDSRPDGQADIFVIDAEGGALRQLTSEPANELEPSWSADGARIYFGSNRTGRWQIWKIPAQGGEAVQVTRDGGYAALESASGNWLYYTRYDQEGIFRVATESGAEVLVPGTDGLSNWKCCTLGEQGLYIVRRNSDQSWLELLDPEAGVARLLRAIPGHADLGVSISPDGRFLLYAEIVRQESDLMSVPIRPF